MKKTILFLAFLFTISLTAQEIKLSGTVTDESKIPCRESLFRYKERK